MGGGSIFNIAHRVYDSPSAYVEVDGIYTNKARAASLSLSFRVTEAALLERAMDIGAKLRWILRNCGEDFTGRAVSVYSARDGNTIPALPHRMKKMMETATMPACARAGGAQRGREVSSRRDPGDMGVGVSFFTEIVGRAVEELFCDILGICDVFFFFFFLFDPAKAQAPHRWGIARALKGQARATRPTGADHRPEIGFPADDSMVEEGNTAPRLWARHLRLR